MLMQNKIFYYTGTGNSLWVARNLASLIGNAELIPISEWMKNKKPEKCSVLGVVFPVHIWGIPQPILDFISEIKNLSPEYIFAIASDSAQVANTLIQFRNALEKEGLDLSFGYEIRMPSNYIPWGGAEPDEKQKQKFENAKKKLTAIASIINNREIQPVDKGPLWQRILLTLVYKLSYSRVPGMDSNFRVDAKCTKCGICSRVCPARNIDLVAGKPVWKHHCEQCMACIQWCPEQAIQYGKKTSQYKRYHHPEISLKDIINEKSKFN